MQPRRDGHGSTRPWSVSRDLHDARRASASVTSERIPSSTFRRLRYSARYLSEIVV
jgi:hypothetical protein